MHINKPVKIVAMGKYLPSVYESHDLERNYGLPEGWSEKNSGVKRRRKALFESNGYMGARALENALEKASWDLSHIDMLIAAGSTFDYPLPHQSSVIKSELKEGLSHHFPAIDIDSTCLSFISAFEMAAALLDGKQYKRIAIVNAEVGSKGLNSKNWETLTLFGDAAVATLVAYDSEGQSGVCKTMQRTYSEGVNHTMIKGGGNKYFARDYPYDEELFSFQMHGIKLLKMAKRIMPEFMDSFFEDLPLNLTEIDVIIPHQASKTGLQIFKNTFAFKPNQVKENLLEYGNCISASIPLLLLETIEKGELQRGDYCFLTGTSAGFGMGGTLIKY